MQTKTAVRRVSLLLAAVLLLSLCGCGTTAQPSVAAAKKDAASAPLAVWFFDAGKADAILLTTENTAVLIDCHRRARRARDRQARSAHRDAL